MISGVRNFSDRPKAPCAVTRFNVQVRGGLHESPNVELVTSYSPRMRIDEFNVKFHAGLRAPSY